MPADYQSLTYRGQTKRMRALAEVALRRFGLRSSTPMVLQGHGENTVFGVRGARGYRYALRIHRLDYQTPASIRSELAWLKALRRDTGLAVQQPKVGRDGAEVQRIEHPGVPGVRSCVLLSWVAGARVGSRRGVEHQQRTGALTAQLHSHAETWKRPQDFTRMRWSERELLLDPVWGDPLGVPGLRAADRELFRRVRDELATRLKAFGKAKRRFGLIHADLHGWNVVRTESGLLPIDFDDCGEGWHLYDMMIAGVAPFWATPKQDAMLAAFMEGYTSVRAFDVGDLDYLHDFIVARTLMICGWLASRGDNPELRERLPGAIKRCRERCRSYLKARS